MSLQIPHREKKGGAAHTKAVILVCSNGIFMQEVLTRNRLVALPEELALDHCLWISQRYDASADLVQGTTF